MLIHDIGIRLLDWRLLDPSNCLCLWVQNATLCVIVQMGLCCAWVEHEHRVYFYQQPDFWKELSLQKWRNLVLGSTQEKHPTAFGTRAWCEEVLPQGAWWVSRQWHGTPYGYKRWRGGRKLASHTSMFGGSLRWSLFRFLGSCSI